MKPGVRTTEFWLSLLGQIAAFVLAMLGKIEPGLAASLVVGTSAVYGTQRAIVEKAEASYDEPLD